MGKTNEIPLVMGWKVIVRPKSAKEMSEGGIVIEAAADAEEHLVYVGQIVAIGEAAYKARTQGGIDMSKWKRVPVVDDWVIFSPYGGLNIRQRGEKKPLRLMNDTDIHAIVNDPDAYFAWIDA